MAGVALAAGEGVRLRPLTMDIPKPLCWLGDRTLLDHAIDALDGVGGGVPVAVNAHYLAPQLLDHLSQRWPLVHTSVERGEALGTAGALGALREWIDGRGALVVNADTWHRAELSALLAGWDGTTVRVLTPTPGPFGARSAVVASLVPWSEIARIVPEPAGLWELVWARHVAAGMLETVHCDGPVIDCATPADYLRANLVWSEGRSVVSDRADVGSAAADGRLVRSVIWPGARVDADERLVDAIRTPLRTVLVR